MKKRRRWDVIIDCMPKNRDIVGVELGVYQGKMSGYLLEALPNLTLYMVDRWSEYTEEERKTSTGRMPKDSQDVFDTAYAMSVSVAHKYGRRAVIVRASTEDALDYVPHSLDFVFIDADHSYDACRNDILNWRDCVKPGGILSGHDYGKMSHPGVTKAVDEVFPGGIETDVNGVWMVRM
ncbi:MAG: class I SAM-dependent methyltransferase [Advenella sp.]